MSKRLLAQAKKRGLNIASGPNEIKLERPNQVPLIRIEVHPWWPTEVKDAVLDAALDAAMKMLPQACK